MFMDAFVDNTLIITITGVLSHINICVIYVDISVGNYPNIFMDTIDDPDSNGWVS